MTRQWWCPSLCTTWLKAKGLYLQINQKGHPNCLAEDEKAGCLHCKEGMLFLLICKVGQLQCRFFCELCLYSFCYTVWVKQKKYRSDEMPKWLNKQNIIILFAKVVVLSIYFYRRLLKISCYFKVFANMQIFFAI